MSIWTTSLVAWALLVLVGVEAAQNRPQQEQSRLAKAGRLMAALQLQAGTTTAPPATTTSPHFLCETDSPTMEACFNKVTQAPCYWSNSTQMCNSSKVTPDGVMSPCFVDPDTMSDDECLTLPGGLNGRCGWCVISQWNLSSQCLFVPQPVGGWPVNETVDPPAGTCMTVAKNFWRSPGRRPCSTMNGHAGQCLNEYCEWAPLEGLCTPLPIYDDSTLSPCTSTAATSPSACSYPISSFDNSGYCGYCAAPYWDVETPVCMFALNTSNATPADCQPNEFYVIPTTTAWTAPPFPYPTLPTWVPPTDPSDSSSWSWWHLWSIIFVIFVIILIIGAAFRRWRMRQAMLRYVRLTTAVSASSSLGRPINSPYGATPVAVGRGGVVGASSPVVVAEAVNSSYMYQGGRVATGTVIPAPA